MFSQCSRLSSSLHWEDALNRVAAAAATTVRDGDKSKDESSNNQKEGDPEHDAGDQIEDLLLASIWTKNDINSFAVIAVKLVDNGFNSIRFSKRQNKHIFNWEEGIDSAGDSDGISSTSIFIAATKTVDWVRTLSSTIGIECETILE